MKFEKEFIDKILEKVNFEKGGGMIPAVVQDDKSGEVLMIAFMNRKALALTLETGKAHFWSRTRQKLWLKGESSGHYQLVKEVNLDCDYDSVLLEVDQVGFCCHTGKETCFHNRLDAQKQSLS